MMRSTLVRSVVLTAVGVGLAFGLTACGGVDKSDLTAKLKTESDFKGLPSSVTDCFADAMLKYGDKDDLQKYVDGKIRIDYVGGMDSKDAEAAGQKCADKVK
ncbi:hypothetical protein [Actinocatenispora sera]|uniref:Uncharacterized protein n=1 Tax=Actinocatenispora sera TaxID=390989 RepID=A0A810L7V3_9ACTN|nr:hypothetical protein [Actinocatenispora sera]BCJ30168.1 hypothetical protein Asera_42760 [Actinocatenispora sera]